MEERENPLFEKCTQAIVWKNHMWQELPAAELAGDEGPDPAASGAHSPVEFGACRDCCTGCNKKIPGSLRGLGEIR